MYQAVTLYRKVRTARGDNDATPYIQMAVYRPIVLVLAVRSRFHSTSVSLIHHSWQTTFQRQITYEFCLLLLCCICNAIATAFIPKINYLNQSNSLQMMSFDI